MSRSLISPFSPSALYHQGAVTKEETLLDGSVFMTNSLNRSLGLSDETMATYMVTNAATNKCTKPNILTIKK